MALPQYSAAVEKARTTEALVLMDAVSKAINSYEVANGIQPSQYILFTGSNATGVLDIDVFSGMDCSSKTNSCQGKNFFYNVALEEGDFYISAHRGQEDDWAFAHPDNGYGFTFRKENGVWTKTCYSYNIKMGKKICASFQGQGWLIL